MALCSCAHMLARLPWLYFELVGSKCNLKHLILLLLMPDARLSLPCKLLACMICRNFI